MLPGEPLLKLRDPKNNLQHFANQLFKKTSNLLALVRPFAK